MPEKWRNMPRLYIILGRISKSGSKLDVNATRTARKINQQSQTTHYLSSWPIIHLDRMLARNFQIPISFDSLELTFPNLMEMICKDGFIG